MSPECWIVEAAPIVISAPRAFVIGDPIGHSRSPLLHGYWLRTLGLPGRYDAVSVRPDSLARFMAGVRQGDFIGGNVTLPHKQAVFAALDRIEPEAAAIGAVNTVWREGETLVGGNTDAHGFLANLDDRAPGWDAGVRQAIVLGAGGAAKAVVWALLQRGFHVELSNRTQSAAHELAGQFGEGVTVSSTPDLSRTDLLVNATSLGMAGAAPLNIDIAALRTGATVCDLVYVPLLTPLLRAAADRSHRTVDGLGMLLHQAVPGFTRWFGGAPEVTAGLREAVAADIARG